MIIWCAVAGLLLLAFILRSILRHHGWNVSRPRLHTHGHSATHPLEIGDEKDMFYIPGDCDDDDLL